MKKRYQIIGLAQYALCTTLIAVALLYTGCKQPSSSPEDPPPKSANITLVFDANGGTFTGSDSGSSVLRSGLPEEQIVLPQPEKEGYAFAGWTPVIYDVFPKTETTYTAQWKTGVGATPASITQTIAGLEGAGPFTVVMTGKLSDAAIKDITTAMSNNPDAMIMLDLSACYGITTFAYDAFKNCVNLTSIALPGTIQTLRDNIFNNCANLVSVTIPDSLLQISNQQAGTPRGHSFSFCPKLEEINIGVGNTAYTVVDNVIFTKDMKKLVAYPAGKKNASYTIPTSVEEIMHYAMDGNTHISSVTLPNGTLKTIGRCIIRGCTQITSLTIPASVISCGDLNDSQIKTTLTSITLNCPTMPNLGDYSTKNEALTTVILAEGITKIPGTAVRNCTKLTSLTIPSTVTTIEMGYAGSGSPFTGCTALKLSVSPLNSTFTMQNGIIYDKKLTTVVYVPAGTSISNLPSTITAFGPYSIHDCNLTTYKFPEGITKIGDRLFYCRDLYSVTLPSTLTEIGSFAFYHTKLSSISIPSGVKTIGSNAFGFTNISSVTIPSSVTSINPQLFNNCKNLTTVTMASPGNWYRTKSYSDAQKKINGEAVDLSNSTQNAVYFSAVDYWYWYRL